MIRGIPNALKALPGQIRSFPNALKASGNFFKSTGRSIFSGLKSAFKSPIATLKKQIINPKFVTTFQINFMANIFSDMAFKGQLPTVKTALISLGESVLSTLVFDKLSDITGFHAVTQLGKRTSKFFVSFTESFTSAAMFKGILTNPGELAQRSFIKSFILAPFFKTKIKNQRLKENHGSVPKDFEDKGIKLSESNIGKKGMTNSQVDNFWKGKVSTDSNTFKRWQQNGSQITQKQWDQLKANDARLQQLQKNDKTMEKLAGKVTDEIVKKKYFLWK
ncbi:hypothetical protein N6H14_33655 [Paenibacillus sp. CC-CFT747]|nr:hypothetical protein N6H14_33655 [Paenibacillus sp. CC-CFT747]